MSELGPTLAALNACLNGSAAITMVVGRRVIRAGGPPVARRHRAWMLAALAFSTLFLTSYLVRIAISGTHNFPIAGPLRTLYFAILGTHTLAAICVPPLVLRALWLAWRGDYERHRRIARIAFPVWLYVSVTGVVVYVMLYRLPGWLGA